jgi:putative tryptophan/tyrosine transport system substrate-binding protein
MIDRRKITALFGAAALASPIEGGDSSLRAPIASVFLSPLTRTTPQYVAMFDELRRLGFVEGQTLTIDPRGFGLRIEQFSEAAAALANAPVDVIQAGGTPAIRAAQQATATIPILGNTDDMVGEGLARSMARPDGNTTGVSFLGTELNGKRQELLIELIPGARHIAALADPRVVGPNRLRTLQDMARAKGVELVIHTVGTPEEIAPAIEAAKITGAAGLNVLTSPRFNANRPIILGRTAALGLPAMYYWPEMAQEGGLVAYGPSIDRIYGQQLSRMLAALFRGTKPADLPIEQPTTFELVVNLRTAKALGPTIPQSILDRADEVIE